MTETQQIINLINQIQGRTPIDCAVAFLKISESLQVLYDESQKGNINVQDFQTSIDNKKAAIEDKKKHINVLNQLINEEKKIEEEQKQIEEEHKELQGRLEKIEELKKMKEDLEKPENDFAALEIEKDDILLGIEEVVNKQIETLDRVNKLLMNSTSAMDSKLVDIIGTVRKNIENLQHQNIALLQELSTKPLQSGADCLDKKLDESIAEYNKYVEKIRNIKEELDKVIPEQNKMIKTYKDRYETDEEIFGELEKPVNVDQYIEESKRQMKEFLESFEKKIKELQNQRSEMDIPERYKRKSASINR